MGTYADIRKRYRQVCDIPTVAAECGVSERTVYRALKGMDLKLIQTFKSAGVNTETAVDILISAGVKKNEVSTILGVSERFINSTLES